MTLPLRAFGKAERMCKRPKFFVALHSNDSSISTKGNRMQAEKKNPSDPDAVVTADAGVVFGTGGLSPGGLVW
jgi:hypothetical protein